MAPEKRRRTRKQTEDKFEENAKKGSTKCLRNIIAIVRRSVHTCSHYFPVYFAGSRKIGAELFAFMDHKHAENTGASRLPSPTMQLGMANFYRPGAARLAVKCLADKRFLCAPVNINNLAQGTRCWPALRSLEFLAVRLHASLYLRFSSLPLPRSKMYLASGAVTSLSGCTIVRRLRCTSRSARFKP